MLGGYAPPPYIGACRMEELARPMTGVVLAITFPLLLANDFGFVMVGGGELP